MSHVPCAQQSSPSKTGSAESVRRLGWTKLVLLLTPRANAKEIKPVVQNLVACLQSDLTRQPVQGVHTGTYNAPALDTNQVWMRLWLAAVVVIAVVAKAQLQRVTLAWTACRQVSSLTGQGELTRRIPSSDLVRWKILPNDNGNVYVAVNRTCLDNWL